MSMFSGASNVRITGGEFNVVKGSYTVFDQSRHHANVNSYNTKNVKTLDSHNDNSKRFYGGDPGSVAQYPQPSQRDQRPSAPVDQQGYFPPPTLHPAMMMSAYQPPGSRTQTVDSFNVDNTEVDNVRNNYSQEYGAPPPSGRRRRRRRPAGQSNAGLQDMEEDDNDDEYAPNSQRFPKQTGPSSFGNVSYGNPPFNQSFGAPSLPQRGFPLPGGGTLPYVNGHRPGTYSTVDFAPGQIQAMSPDLHRSFSQMMEQVRIQTAPEPQPSIPPYHQPIPQDEEGEEYGDQEEEDEGSDSEEEGEDARMGDPLVDPMANLSINEGLRPAFSRVKSDPQQPMPTGPTHLTVPFARLGPRQAESAQNLPDRLREPFVNAPPAMQGDYTPTYQRNLSPRSASSVPAEFGLNSPGVIVEGGPIYRDINGDYNKYDQTYHTTNIGSGNTSNTVIKDSFNDGSIKYYAPPEARTTGRRQGRIPK